LGYTCKDTAAVVQRLDADMDYVADTVRKADPHLRARDMIVTAADGSRQYAPPFRLAGHAFTIARAAPLQGEHSAEVLREAGFSGEEVAALAAGGTIVGTAPTG